MKRVLAAVIVATIIGVPMAGDLVVGDMDYVRMITVVRVRMAVQVAVVVQRGNGVLTTFNLGQEVVNGAMVNAGKHVLLVRVLAAVIEVRDYMPFCIRYLYRLTLYISSLTYHFPYPGNRRWCENGMGGE